MDSTRFEKQLDFILEIDKLKSVLRRSYVLTADRNENDAEHSWHISVLATLLSEYANKEVDVLRVIKMLLIHDIVEIDAGDAYCYDEDANIGQHEREKKAAGRLFGLLPVDQSKELIILWEEFEGLKTPEAKFARALDMFMPLLHNYYTKGKSWKEHGVRKKQVVDRNISIKDGSIELWEFANSIAQKAVEKGYLTD